MSARFILALLMVSASVIPDQSYATGPTRNKQIAACKVSPVLSGAHYPCGFDCPMMNDTTLSQIATVKTMVNKGNHIWTSNHI
jgi:hypothetical protein